MTAIPFTALAPQQAPTVRSGAADSAGFATFPLASAPEAVKSAREKTRSTLHDWGLDELTDDAMIVVSELVTNAVRYGLGSARRERPLPPATPEQPFLLSLVHCERSVLCAVFDPGREVPELKEPDYLQESGRGLHVLESLAERWGWTTPDRHGKAVWALLVAGDVMRPLSRTDPEWEPLTRLLLLLELLSGPSWLKALSTTVLPHSRP